MHLGKNWIYYVVSNKNFPLTPMENVDYFRNAIVGLAHLGWHNSRIVEPDLVLIARYEGTDFNSIIHSSVIWNEENGSWEELTDELELNCMNKIPLFEEE